MSEQIQNQPEKKPLKLERDAAKKAIGVNNEDLMTLFINQLSKDLGNKLNEKQVYDFVVQRAKNPMYKKDIENRLESAKSILSKNKDQKQQQESGAQKLEKKMVKMKNKELGQADYDSELYKKVYEANTKKYKGAQLKLMTKRAYLLLRAKQNADK